MAASKYFLFNLYPVSSYKMAIIDSKFSLLIYCHSNCIHPVKTLKFFLNKSWNVWYEYIHSIFLSIQNTMILRLFQCWAITFRIVTIISICSDKSLKQIEKLLTKFYFLESAMLYLNQTKKKSSFEMYGWLVWT